MEPSNKLNVHAPIFTPGKPWKMQDTDSRRPLPTEQSVGQLPRTVSQSVFPKGNLRLSGTISQLKRGYSIASTARGQRLEKLQPTGGESIHMKLRKLTKAPRPMSVDNTIPAAHSRQVFDYYFGFNVHNLRAWQDICFFCGINPAEMPGNIADCRELLNRTYINVFDFVEAVVNYRVVEPRFDNARDLETYSRQTGKICPVAAAKGNKFFRFMFRKWF